MSPNAANYGLSLADTKTEFKALLGFGKLTSFAGWVGAGLGILLVLAGIVMADQAILVRAVLAVGGAVMTTTGFGMVCFGQLISCFVMVERNTRATAEAILRAGLPPSATNPYNP